MLKRIAIFRTLLALLAVTLLAVACGGAVPAEEEAEVAMAECP